MSTSGPVFGATSIFGSASGFGECLRRQKKIHSNIQ
jgi:hypothetical protein